MVLHNVEIPLTSEMKVMFNQMTVGQKSPFLNVYSSQVYLKYFWFVTDAC